MKHDMKTIMIIGAGKGQVPLIEAAKRENYHTIVCDIDSESPGVTIADEYRQISTKDRNALYEVARDKHIDGIIANSEYAMCDVAYIANRLHLIGNFEEAISILSSKSKFREMQHNTGLFTPRFVNYNYKQQKEEISFPIIIKPDMSSGSRGTTVVRDIKDIDTLQRSIKECSKISRNGKVIIEDYIKPASGLTVEGEVFVHNGEIIWDGLFSTKRSDIAPMIPMTYVFPCVENERRIAVIKEALERAFLAAGVIHGEYNIEALFTEDGKPFIIEINPRQGGNYLPRYVQEHCGIDLYRLLVTTAVGDDEYWNKLKRTGKKYIIHHVLYPEKSGCFRGVQIDESVEKYVYRVQIDAQSGDDIEKTTDGSRSIGHVDLRFTDSTEQIRVCNQIEELIRIDTD